MPVLKPDGPIRHDPHVLRRARRHLLSETQDLVEVIEVPMVRQLADPPEELLGNRGEVVGQEVLPAGREDRERGENRAGLSPERREGVGAA